MTPYEQWRPIPDTDDRYDVSDLGRVRSWTQGHGKRRTEPLVLKLTLSTKGYPRVKVYRSGVPVEVHKLVMRAFVGPCPVGLETRHLDGNPLNSHLTNLRYGTKSENMMDKRRHGTNYQANKTHCPSGHSYDEVNTYRKPSTRERQCLECKRAGNRIYMRSYSQRKRAELQAS